MKTDKMANQSATQPANPGDKIARKPLVIAFFTIFLDLVGFGMMIPIQSFYAQEFGASPSTITWLGGSFSLMQFLFAHFWGRLSDRVGRRPIILISVAISALGHFVFALAPTLSLLFVARMIAGFGNANLATAQAIISDTTTRENRAKGMGLIGAAFGLGFIFGPAIGGLLGQISPTAPSWGAGILALVNLAFAYFMLPETRRPDSAPAPRRSFAVSTYLHAAKLPNVGPIFAMTLSFTFAFALMEHVIGLLIESVWVQGLTGAMRISAASSRTAWYLVVIGLTATMIQGGLIGKLTKRFGEVRLSRSGLAIVTLAFITIPLIAYSEMYGLLLVNGAIMACGTGIYNPSNLALLSKSAGDHEQGGVLGLNQSLAALGRVIGPAMAGPLFELHHWTPFWVGAGVMAVVSLPFALRLQSPGSRGSTAAA